MYLSDDFDVPNVINTILELISKVNKMLSQNNSVVSILTCLVLSPKVWHLNVISITFLSYKYEKLQIMF